jgi:hypothetical protein
VEQAVSMEEITHTHKILSENVIGIDLLGDPGEDQFCHYFKLLLVEIFCKNYPE